MANMIIRPAAGTGNKVIVQDQAGGAVLTTADSGADYVGTTKGTIDSTATFPAGHVIGMASYSTRSTSHLVAANGGADFSATNIDITVKNASSKMIINFTTGANRRDSGVDGFTYIKRTVDPSGSPTTTFVDGFADGEGGHLNKKHNDAGGDHGQSFFTIDTHGQAVGTVIRYFIRAYAGTVHDNYYVIVDDVATHHGGYVLEVMT